MAKWNIDTWLFLALVMLVALSVYFEWMQYKEKS